MLPQLFDVLPLGIIILEYVHLPQVSRWILSALQTDQDEIASKFMRIHRTCDSFILKECCVKNKLSLLLRWYSRSQLGSLVSISQSLQSLLLSDEKQQQTALFFQEFFTQPVDQSLPNACLFPFVITDDAEFKTHVTQAFHRQNPKLLLRAFAHAKTISHHDKEQLIIRVIRKTYSRTWKSDMIDCLCSLPFDQDLMSRALRRTLNLSSLRLYDHAAYESLYTHGLFTHDLDYCRFGNISNPETAAMFYNADCILTENCSSFKINQVASTHALSPTVAWNIFLNSKYLDLNDDFFRHLTPRHLGLIEGGFKKFVLRCAGKECNSGLRWAAKYLVLDNNEANECVLKMCDADTIFTCIQAWNVILYSQTIDRLTDIALVDKHFGLWSLLVQNADFKVENWTKNQWVHLSQLSDIRFVTIIWENNDFWQSKGRFLFMKALESRCKEQAHYWNAKCVVDPNIMVHHAWEIFQCELWELLASIAHKIPPLVVQKYYRYATIDASQQALEFLDRMWPQQESFFLQDNLLQTALSNNHMFVCFFYRVGRLSGDSLILALHENPCRIVLEHLNFDIDTFLEPLNIVQTIYFED